MRHTLSSVILFLLASSAGAQCLRQRILPPDLAAQSRYGYSLDVEGSTLFVGAGEDPTGGFEAGAVYTYDLGNLQGGTWMPGQRLLPSDLADGDEFGSAIDVEGDLAVIAADLSDAQGVDSGAAYVFARSAGGWTEQAKLTTSLGRAGDLFGVDVAIEGDWILVGAPHANALGPDSGSAHVFRRTGSGWVEHVRLSASDGRPGDYFGHNVGLSGTTAIVGAWMEDRGSGPNAGAAYVFEIRPDGTWVETQKLVPNQGRPGDGFGIAVDLDGERALIGARAADVGGLTDAGAAYVFERQADGLWAQTRRLTATVPDARAEYGHKVALEGDRAVVGAWLTDVYARRAGAVFVYELSSAGWEERHRLANPRAAPADVLGHDVGLAGDFVIAGAFLEDNERGVNAGAAYAFDLSQVAPASASFRTAGSNPPSLLVSGSHGGRPVLGGTLSLTLDIASTGHTLGRVVAFLTPAELDLRGRTLLVNTLDPFGEVLALPLTGTPNYTVDLPDDITFCGLPLHVQGLHLSATQPFVLSNAWDLVVGTH